MKKIYTLIAAALLATGAAAQNPTAYFMEGSTFRSQFNPAFGRCAATSTSRPSAA